MQPAVRRLQETYGDTVTFRMVDAESSAGAGWFQQLGLPGHPSYVIFTADGQEIYRDFGIVAQAALEAPLNNLLE